MSDLPALDREWLDSIETVAQVDGVTLLVMTWAAEGDLTGAIPRPATVAHLAKLLELRRVELGDLS